MHETRLVLKQNVTEDCIEKLARMRGWRKYKVVKRTENAPYEKIWMTVDQKSSIHYVEDFLLNVRYLKIQSIGSLSIESYLRANLDVVGDDEIREIVREAYSENDRNNLIQAIYYVGAAAGKDFNPEYFAYFKIMFEHADPEVRRAAIFATAYAPWPEFLKTLELLRSVDPISEVRYIANLTISNHMKQS